MTEPQNERLRGAIASAQLNIEDVATHTETAPKTVERWITRGRLPHRRTRIAITELLGVGEEYLWPETAQEARSQAASSAELLEFYPSRAAVPTDTWRSLVDGTHEALDVLVYASSFLFEQFDLASMIRMKAQEGVKFRLLFGNESSAAVKQRAREEGTRDYLERACQLSRRYLRDLNGYRSVEVRTHKTTLYTSIYRFDQDALVNMHTYGAPAGQNPIMHLRRIHGGRLWDHYMRSFEQVWTTATPEPQADTRQLVGADLS